MKLMGGFSQLHIVIIILLLTGGLITAYSVDQKSKISPNKKAAVQTTSPSATILIISPSQKPVPTNSPTHFALKSPIPAATQVNIQFVSIVSPTKNTTYKYGDLIPVEIHVQDPSKVSRIDLAWGKNGYLSVQKSFTSAPYTTSFRITEYSPYMIDGNKLTIGAYVYDKEEKYFTAHLTDVIMSPADLSVSFTKPTNEQSINGTNTLAMEAEVSGNTDIDRVEFYVGAGSLVKTFTSKPYSFNYDISNITCCTSPKYLLPLQVRAFTKDGRNVSQSIGVYISK